MNIRTTMKKPRLEAESPPPRQVRRADIAPATGFAIIVDGQFKSEFDDEETARKAANGLLTKYPKLTIQIYDAASKSRAPVK